MFSIGMILIASSLWAGNSSPSLGGGSDFVVDDPCLSLGGCPNSGPGWGGAHPGDPGDGGWDHGDGDWAPHPGDRPTRPHPGRPNPGRPLPIHGVEQFSLQTNGIFHAGDKIFLRAELQRMGIATQHYDLRFVDIVVAGQGPIALFVNGAEVDRKGIIREGRPLGGGWYRVRLNANQFDQAGFGVWQIHFVGGPRSNYQIDRVTVGLQGKRGNGRPPVTREQTFHNPQCAGYACSCFARSGQVSNENADLFCRMNGFRGSDFSRLWATQGPIGQVQCSANGNCFTNRNRGNLICQQITCW